jgi:antirestriction protein ArdC
VSLTAKAESLNVTLTEAIEALASETDAVKQNEMFKAWLRSASRFYKYSWGNQLLIATQCPSATQVAGFNTWRSMGRFVQKGQKAIYIMAPIVRRIRETGEEQGENSDNTTNQRKSIAGFRAATVFDVSQTEGEPLPEAPNHNATEGGQELLPRLEAAVATFGVNLRYEAISGRAEGYSTGGLIVIEESHPVPAKCGTIAHELAHELLHQGTNAKKSTKQQRELEAEAVAFVVLDHYGMRSGSQFYLHSYGVTGDMLTASMQTIAATARQIIDRIDGTSSDREEAEEDSVLPLAA